MTFDTGEFEPAQRLDRWRGTMSSLYEIGLPEQRPDFFARATVWHLGPMVVNAGEYIGGQSVRRTPQLIRRDQIDHFKLTFRESGHSEIDAGGRPVSVAPGDLVIEDLGRPGRYVAHGGRNIVLYIAREALRGAAGHPDGLHGTLVRGPATAILSSHLRSLVSNISSLRAEQAQGIAAATTLLLRACLAPTNDLLQQARPLIDTNLTRQICRYIEEHLTDPSLSVQVICGQFHVSRATLYRLFSELGGVQAFVRERRLTRVHAVLSSNAAPRYLARLADDYGFSSASDFARAFKARFGYSPTDARAIASMPEFDPSRAADGPEAFSAWMNSVKA